jgi:hypothetical protein
MVQGFARMKKMLDEMAVMQANVSNAASHAASITASQWKGAGMAMMSVGYIADDLQYGFRSIVNNIQPMGTQIAMAFGAASGEAMAFGGALGIVAVGVNQLINHWSDLTDMMQAAWSGSTVEQLHNIRKAAEEATEAFEKVPRPKAERKEAGKVSEMVAEADKDKLAHRLGELISASPMRAEMEAGEKKRLGILEEWVAGGGGAAAKRDLAQTREAIGDRLAAANRQKADELLGAATQAGPAGANARLTIRRFFPKMANDIEAATPEGQGRQADFDRDQKTRKEVQKRIKAAEQVHQKELQLEVENQRRIDAEKRRREAADRAEEIKRFDVRAEVQRRIKGQEAAQQRKLDEELAAGRRALDMKEKKEREAAVGERKDEVAARHGRHLRWQVQDIMKGARPERARAEFMGFAEFAKSTQLGIMNNPAEIQKKQLEALERIRRLLEDNPQMKVNIMAAAAVAAGPP